MTETQHKPVPPLYLNKLHRVSVVKLYGGSVRNWISVLRRHISTHWSRRSTHQIDEDDVCGQVTRTGNSSSRNILLQQLCEQQLLKLSRSDDGTIDRLHGYAIRLFHANEVSDTHGQVHRMRRGMCREQRRRSCSNAPHEAD